MDFTNKAVKQKAGHFALSKNQESIFKSPDTITGKVGVVGSGKVMTQYEAQKIKYQEKFKNETEKEYRREVRELESLQNYKRSRY